MLNCGSPLHTDFDTGAESWTLPRPVWGTCPMALNEIMLLLLRRLWQAMKIRDYIRRQEHAEHEEDEGRF